MVSAAIMGLLIFAKPVMFYLDGNKKEGIHLALYTVGFLVVIALLFFITLALISAESSLAI